MKYVIRYKNSYTIDILSQIVDDPKSLFYSPVMLFSERWVFLEKKEREWNPETRFSKQII